MYGRVAKERFRPSSKRHIALAWPFLLDGRIALQLVLNITSSHDGGAEARIVTYHFRTRRPSEEPIINNEVING